MKKSILTAIAAIAITSLSFAGTPKGDAKIANNESPTETKVEAKVQHTYWILSRNEDGTYTLTDEDTGECANNKPDPCKIVTDTDYSLQGMKAPQEDVDQENGIQILEFRDL